MKEKKDRKSSISGPHDGDQRPPALPPLEKGLIEVVELGEGRKIVIVGTSDGDKILPTNLDRSASK